MEYYDSRRSLPMKNLNVDVLSRALRFFVDFWPYVSGHQSQILIKHGGSLAATKSVFQRKTLPGRETTV